MKKKNIILLLAVLALAALTAMGALLYGWFGKSKEKAAEPIETEEPKETAGMEEAEPEPEEAAASEAASGQAEKQEAKKTQGSEQRNSSSDESIKACQTRLEELVQTEYGAGGSVAVCAGRAGESDMAMVNGGPMQAASLIKLYVAGCVYENYGAVRAAEAYSGETEALLQSMITVSDNTSCNVLVTRLGSGSAQSGMALVNEYCERYGFFDTHMGRLMLQPNDADDNYTSVKDCCNFLKMANDGQLDGSEAILNYMKQQERREKIPAGLPSGVTVGNKTGELDTVENDAGIVYADGGTYVLCVMSENLADTYSARQFIARTSGVVYEMLR